MYTNSNRTSKMENWSKKKGEEDDLIYILIYRRNPEIHLNIFLNSLICDRMLYISALVIVILLFPDLTSLHIRTIPSILYPSI